MKFWAFFLIIVIIIAVVVMVSVKGLKRGSKVAQKIAAKKESYANNAGAVCGIQTWPSKCFDCDAQMCAGPGARMTQPPLGDMANLGRM